VSVDDILNRQYVTTTYRRSVPFFNVSSFSHIVFVCAWT